VATLERPMCIHIDALDAGEHSHGQSSVTTAAAELAAL
jgi:hypothetical protein